MLTLRQVRIIPVRFINRILILFPMRAVPVPHRGEHGPQLKKKGARTDNDDWIVSVVYKNGWINEPIRPRRNSFSDWLRVVVYIHRCGDWSGVELGAGEVVGVR